MVEQFKKYEKKENESADIADEMVLIDPNEPLHHDEFLDNVNNLLMRHFNDALINAENHNRFTWSPNPVPTDGSLTNFTMKEKTTGKIMLSATREGCTLSQPITDKSLDFLKNLFPESKQLQVKKCNLKSALALIESDNGKGTYLFTDEVINKIIKNANKDKPEDLEAKDKPEDLEKFLEYCSKPESAAKKTKQFRR